MTQAEQLNLLNYFANEPRAHWKSGELHQFPVWSMNDGDRFTWRSLRALIATARRSASAGGSGQMPNANEVLDWANDAVHESGHCIVAFCLGRTPRSIEIDMGTGFKHRGIYVSEQMEIAGDITHAMVIDYFAATIAESAAGVVAQSVVFSRNTQRWSGGQAGAGEDFENARSSAQTILDQRAKRNDFDLDLRTVIEQGVETAEQILFQRKEALVALACAVLKTRMLDGTEILGILREHRVPRLPRHWHQAVVCR